MIVIDASALVTALVGGDPQERGAVQGAIGDAIEVHAPDLIVLEVLNALRGLVRGARIAGTEADAARAALELLRVRPHPSGVLAARAWELRDRLSAYDAAYLATAERVAARLLVTGDRGLANAAAGVLGRERVLLVG